MSDIPRSTSPASSMELRAPEISGEDRSTGGFDGVARSRASINAPISRAPEFQPEVVEEDRLAGGPDNAASSRASANRPISPPSSEHSQIIDDENEAVSSNPHQADNPPVKGPRQSTRKETFFGMPRPSASRPANFHPNYDDDYETRFPPDPIYKEASENARVFRVYMEEAAKYDALMTDEAREGLDVNLVFAGLFSAVLTTFVAQTSQSLQPDRATESTLLLREIAALQRAQMNGTSADSVPPTSADFVPSSIDVWVNGLWFTSLTLSLASALFAVLIKQWIRYYMSLTSGTVRDRSLIHQFRLRGLQKWHVATLISILPVLMHLSLAIFFAGLTLFLLPLRRSIAGIIGSASAFIFLAYIGTSIWPLFQVQCPYHSPLTNIVHCLLVRLRMLQDRRKDAVPGDVVPAFEWLFKMSSNPSVHRVIVQAVGGCFRRSSAMTRLTHSFGFGYTWYNMLAESFYRLPNGKPCIRPEKVDFLERLFRCNLHMHFWRLDTDFCTISSFPAPTIQWEAVATALLWHNRYRVFIKGADCSDIALAQKACSVVNRLLLGPRNEDTWLPLILWQDLVAAASSWRSIPLQDFLDRVLSLNDTLTFYLCGWRDDSRLQDQGSPNVKHLVSFEGAVRQDENLIWSLLLPFDECERNALDSEKVQRLLSLLNVIISHGTSRVNRNVFFGMWKELICYLQGKPVTPKDKDAICTAVGAFLQCKDTFTATFGSNAVLLPSLSFLYCWTPTSRSSRTHVVSTLLEIDMSEALNELENIGNWLWSVRDYENGSEFHGNFTAPVASLVASIVRPRFESRSVASASCPEDSQLLAYLSLPENSAAIVSMLTFQGNTWTPASVAQVRSDLDLFFASRSWDREILQNCRESLDWYLEHFVPYGYREAYKDNVEEARRVIDGLISGVEEPPEPAYRLSRLFRRSRPNVDAEAR